mmetsp:Transcript_4740/g.8379  ORF Transcript_4740/g.8379 Transcript_4740/m.8379 type:complete len:1851 (+) Transcript_4740:174-5726(+)
MAEKTLRDDPETEKLGVSSWLAEVVEDKEENAVVSIRVNGKTKEVNRISLFIFPVDNVLRKFLLSIVEWKWFERFILFCIVLNSIFLASHNYRESEDVGFNGFITHIADHILTAIFTLECVLKILAWGLVLGPKGYLRDPWNILDFIVVVAGIIGWVPGGEESGLSFLRLFRVLRPLRSLNAVPQMKVLVNTVISSVPRLGNVTVMGIFLFIVFGIIGITLMNGIFFRQCRVTRDPVLLDGCWSWPPVGDGRLCGGRNMCEDGGYCGGHELDPADEFRPNFEGGKQDFPWCEGSAPTKVFPETDWVHFDHLGGAFLLIFQCMTLEGWTDLMYMVQDGYSVPLGWIYFFFLVTITSFFMLNIALAVVDEARDDFDDAQKDELADDELREASDSEDSSLLGRFFKCVRDHDPDEIWWDNKFIQAVATFADWEPFKSFILLTIFVNVVMLMSEMHEPLVALASPLEFCGKIVLGIFVFEMVVMLTALGPKGYVLNPVTCFDGLVVILSIVEEATGGGGALTAMRCLRLFRVLNKLASNWEAFRVLLKAMVQTAFALNYWLVLFLLVMCIFTLSWMQFFALEFKFKDTDSFAEVEESAGEIYCGGTDGLEPAFRQGCIPRAHFDTFVWGFVTIFQIMTGENWNTIMYAGMRAKGWGFSVLFMIIILFGQILFLSLFLSMLISKFDEVQDEIEDQERAKTELRKSRSSQHAIGKAGRAAGSIAKIASAFRTQKVAPDDELTTAPGEPISALVDALGDSPEDDASPSSKMELDVAPETLPEDATTEPAKVEKKPRKWPHGYSWFVFTESNPLRAGANKLLEFEIMGIKVFDNFILVCILISSTAMALDGPLNDPDHWGTQFLRGCDQVFSIVFIMEMSVKLCAFPLWWGDHAYLKSGWNWLDGTVVMVSVAGFVTDGSASFLKTLRIIRALRPLRVIARNENLKVVVQTVFKSLQDLLALIIVFSLFLLIFALIALMYLRGRFYKCSEEVGFQRSLGEDFVTPICLGTNISDDSIKLGYQSNATHWSTVNASCGGQHPLQWQRATADTPICVARCDPEWASEQPAPSWLCPPKYSKPQELPSVCSGDFVATNADEQIGMDYVVAMTRSFTVPCSGSTVVDGEVVVTGSAVSCRDNFCGAGVPKERTDGCRSDCDIHPIFCKDTCENSTSPECTSCREECVAACECRDFCEPLIRDAALCSEQGSSWKPYVQQNFDNVVAAMITLFEISTTEGWVDVMYAASDSVDFYVEPVRDVLHYIWAPFFSAWIFLSFMFLINLSVGVIVDKFVDIKNQGAPSLLTDSQQKWVMSRKSLHARVVFFDLTDLHLLPKRRRQLYDVISNKYFDYAIMGCIVLNTAFMCCKVFPAPTDWWESVQEGINYFFACVYTVEAVMKLFVLRTAYFKDNWNLFDFTCVAATLLGVVIKYGTGLNVASMTAVLRIFRIARLFRLLRFMKGLNRLFLALVLSIPKLVNVVLILLLLVTLFSILGVSLFSCVKFSDTMNEYGNFRNFFWAFTTLFRASTGEAWNNIMHDLAKDEKAFFREGSWCTPASLFDWQDNFQVLKDKCLIDKPNMCVASYMGVSPLPFIYWIAFTLLITLMIMNLVIAVILEGYEDGKASPAAETVERCIEVWKKYDPDHTMSLPMDKVIMYINDVLAAGLSEPGELSKDAFVPHLVIDEDGVIDFSLFPMKYAKAFDLRVSEDHSISFINATKQVLRLSVLEGNLEASRVSELDETDNRMDPKDLAQLKRKERKAATRSDSKKEGLEPREDFTKKIAASKLQKRFREQKLYRLAIKHGMGEGGASALSAFLGVGSLGNLLHQDLDGMTGADESNLRLAGGESNGEIQPVAMPQPPVAG